MGIALCLMFLILEGAGVQLTGQRWNLIELEGKPVTVLAGSEDRDPHMILDAVTERVSGSGGCNRFSGPFELEEDKLRFGPLASTRMACPEGMELEAKFLEALGKVAFYRLEEDTLTLLDSEKKPLLRFQASTRL